MQFIYFCSYDSMLVLRRKNKVCAGGGFSANLWGCQVWRLLRTSALVYGVTHGPPALLPASNETSATFSTWHATYAPPCSLQAEWQWLTETKVDRNYGHNLEADSDYGRIDGKIHRKSKLSVSPRKTRRKRNNTFQSKSPMHMRLNKPRLRMPPSA